MTGSQWEIYTVQNTCGAGRRTLIFPITFKRTFAGRCCIREQNIDFGIIPEREFILPHGTNCQNFRELSGKQICSDTERRARNPVEDNEISETIARRSVKDSLTIFSESSRTNWVRGDTGTESETIARVVICLAMIWRRRRRQEREGNKNKSYRGVQSNDP